MYIIMRAKLQKTKYLQYPTSNFFVPLPYEIGIIVAMDKEFKQLNTILSDTQTEHINHKNFVRGNLEDKEIILNSVVLAK